ncbi:bleomycin hydrolase isoform X1 [Neodiprion fabricii]|uniref:bleomycin hydrolase isoform X1 n=2 Tax=Neodiprion fabricii TaxID=2872261 RepID=UPI001ED910FD|nr:bleomycin hydrolase isoform X1 [Neodiprion fabricii]
MVASARALTPDIINELRNKFYENEKNVLAQNVCTKIDPLEACMSRKYIEEAQHVFNHKVELEGKPITNQKNSGRCWIFATLNVMRIPFMQQHNLEEFEFSQGYLFFWDKLERCNYFLHNMVKAARSGESVNGRLVSWLLHDPTCDGGQWDMIVNLINRHGLVPKKLFPESFSCESTMRMNSLLKSKLREFGKALRDMIASGASDADLESQIIEQMTVIYRIIGICLGIPSEKFTWEYYDKTKNYNCIGPITPVEFYEKYVKPSFNVDDKVCLVTDPRPTNPYGKLYTVDYLGNVVGGRSTIYNNQPVELLMNLCAESIKQNEPVWFGCEVSKRFAMKQGIQDLEAHDFKLVFGTDVQIGLTKADRLLYGDSMMTHAMAFTAVSTDANGKIKKFRVENSWGDERGEKGYHVLSADWFSEFVFEVVVDKKYVPDDVMAVFQQEPTVLPAWDPMGTLAQ